MRLRRRAIGAAVACLGAVPALAAEHVVVLTGFAYFPEITYAQPGDTILFVNQSEETKTVAGRDGVWVAGPIASGAQALVTVTQDMNSDFFTAYGSCATTSSCSVTDPTAAYGTVEGAAETSTISFDPPPSADG